MEKYIYGSSAFKIEDDIYRHPSTEEIEAKRIAEENKKEALRRKFVMNICVYGLIVFLLGAGTVYSKVLVMQASSTVQAKETELAKLMEENNNKKIQFEQSIDLKKIEELAITKYGMQRPDKNQTVYVNVVQSDYGEVVSSRN